ncbi:TPA: hypothetical protein NJ375_004487 [Vibrio parahaemolyticus]|nr:hypothetical protein [Vibrio parahaemolyticus]HCG7315050.1 hypothetical protein [Vibrio parahaemolyticus]
MYEEKLNIPKSHKLVRKSCKSEQRKGRDTDIYGYDELDQNGELIAKYIVRDSMSIYPPQSTTVSFVKYDVDGTEIETGTL